MSRELTEADLRAISDHYDGGIASMDAYLGELFDRLRTLGLYDDALIIVTSDHGESLGARGEIGHGGLYLEQLLVPLIIKFPASTGLGPAVVDDPASLLDVMPTVYDVCGVELPEDVDGHSLVPVASGQDGGRTHLITQMAWHEGKLGVTNAAKRAVLEPGRWLLVDDAKAGSVELYDLQADPQALVPTPVDRPDQVAALLRALKACDPRAATGPHVEPAEVPISDELRAQLESLGYLDQ